MATTVTKFDPNPATSRTFAGQSKLPKLPVPSLEESTNRYLRALQELQTPEEHEQTKRVVNEFLQIDGPRLQEKLLKWAETRDRCVLWCSLSLDVSLIISH